MDKCSYNPAETHKNVVFRNELDLQAHKKQIHLDLKNYGKSKYTFFYLFILLLVKYKKRSLFIKKKFKVVVFRRRRRRKSLFFMCFAS